MKKVCIVNDKSKSITKMFKDRGFEIVQIDSFSLSQTQITKKEIVEIQSQIDLITGCDLVVYDGGTDINPSLYGQIPVAETNIPDKARDFFEIKCFNASRKEAIPQIGICRGAQLLNVLSGGSMIQHTSRHQTGHPIVLTNGEEMYASANHHQIMIPSKLGKVLAKSYDNDPEVIYYHNNLCLSHQPHPEWMDIKEKYVEYFFEHTESMLKEREIFK